MTRALFTDLYAYGADKGNEWWTSSLEMPLEKGWRQWTVNSQTAGYVTSYASDFTFLTVKGSGHM